MLLYAPDTVGASKLPYETCNLLLQAIDVSARK